MFSYITQLLLIDLIASATVSLGQAAEIAAPSCNQHNSWSASRALGAKAQKQQKFRCFRCSGDIFSHVNFNIPFRKRQIFIPLFHSAMYIKNS